MPRHSVQVHEIPTHPGPDAADSVSAGITFFTQTRM
jgi:hypothetical protein